MKNTHKIATALISAILLVTVGMGAALWAFRQVEETGAARQHIKEVTSRADDLLAAIVDAETGQRGFCITGDAAFLDPYFGVRDRIGGELAELRQRTEIDEAQRRLAAAAPLIDAKMSEMARVVQLRRNGDTAAVIAAVGGGQGRRLMDAIRAEFQGFVQVENGAFAKREAQFLAEMRRLFAAIVAVSVLAMLSALAFAFLIYRETQHRLRALVHIETQHLLELQTATTRELQQSNATLRLSEDNLKKLLKENGDLKSALDEHAIVAITDPRGRIVFVNDKFCDISKYAREELIGRDHRIVNSGHHPKEFIRGLWDTIAGGRVWHGEMRNRAKDGSFYWVDTTIVPFLDDQGQPRQYVAIRADITERKRHEVAAAQLASIVTSSEDAIVGKTLEGIVTSWNAGAAKTFGYTSLEMEGTPIARLIPADRQQEEAEILNKVGRGQSVLHFETVRLHKDGRAIDVSVTVSPIRDPEGKIVGASKIVRDITERKAAEAAILRLNTELEQRVAERTSELEMANKEMEAFSYSVSHDLRTPVRAIDGYSQAVLEDFGPQLPEEGRRYLRTIRQSAEHMGALIDSLLAFAHLKRQELNRSRIDTNELVREALAELGAPWPARRITLCVGPLPESYGDRVLLKQVWINLLSNALKYTGKRGQATIEIGRLDAQGPDTFFVRDNGVGFDMRHAAKLFTVFQRFHLAEDYEGSGVGLAIVHRIVQRHGGRVWADAAVDHGATFFFTLQPIAQS